MTSKCTITSRDKGWQVPWVTDEHSSLLSNAIATLPTHIIHIVHRTKPWLQCSKLQLHNYGEYVCTKLFTVSWSVEGRLHLYLQFHGFPDSAARMLSIGMYKKKKTMITYLNYQVALELLYPSVKYILIRGLYTLLLNRGCTYISMSAGILSSTDFPTLQHACSR